MSTLVNQCITNLLNNRDEAYNDFAIKAENIFYKRFVKNNPSYEDIYPTQSHFHIGDVCQGMSLTNYVECALAQGKSPTWLANQLYVVQCAADLECQKEQRGAA